MTEPASTRPAHPVLWGMYLGVSWTWCIGMFLPILLVRDYGLGGYLVFALPNVVGAGAMGWVLRDQTLSQRLVEKHAPAMGVFGAVTIAFHFYFLFWLLGLVQEINQRASVSFPTWALATIGVLGLALVWVVRRASGPGAITRVALAVWLLSIGTLIALLVGSAPDPGPGAMLGETADTGELIWMAPVCLFGFALCPYMDLTFHHARQQTTGSGARTAFTLGFGVFFLAMILLTLVYSGLFGGVLGAPIEVSARASWARGLIVTHIAIQALFTVLVHRERIRATSNVTGALATIALGGIAALLGLFHGQLPGVGDMSAGEVVYRCFMAFYGLVFPAYVWVVMIPTRDGHSGLAGARGRRKARTMAFSASVAAPMFWMGFIMGQEAWLAPGLAIVLLSRLTLGGGGQAPSTSAAA